LQHRLYWSNDDLPVFLDRFQDLVDGAKARARAALSCNSPQPNLQSSEYGSWLLYKKEAQELGKHYLCVILTLTIARPCLSSGGTSCLFAFSNNWVWRL
jgi:hypothetical protein